MRERRPGLKVIRILLMAFGSVILLLGAADRLTPRARYLDSSPSPMANLSTPPAEVWVSFNRDLDPGSTISVVSTVSLPSSGKVLYTGGVNVQDASRPNPPAANESKLLRAALRPELPRGLYQVDWQTVEARRKAVSHGRFYFGVGMPVPEHIQKEMHGPRTEHDIEIMQDPEGSHLSALSFGLLLIGLGLLLPLLSRRGRES